MDTGTSWESTEGFYRGFPRGARKETKMDEFDCLDGNRVRSEYEMKLLERLRHEKAANDCLLVGNMVSWLFSLVLAIALVFALNI